MLSFIEGLWGKFYRQLTGFFPPHKNRVGSCNRCGECCKLPYRCPMLRYDDDGLARCAIYHLRPPSCRVYPRTAGEHRTQSTCGFSFQDATVSGDKVA